MKFFVFDVESVGLHGEGFAFGYVVIDEKGMEFDHGICSCPLENARGTAEGRKWVSKNCPSFDVTCFSPKGLREIFRDRWEMWRKKGAILAAECPYPVETNFLEKCRKDCEDGSWSSPYPLIDISSVRLAAGFDPVGKCSRRANEVPEHHPLKDARQSARLLLEALKACSYRPPKPDQAERYTEIRNKANDFAKMLNENCPQSVELITAMSRLEEVVMWANAAIARNEM